MKMIAAGIAALLLCTAAAAGAGGEARAVDTETNGRITQTDWLDENGQLTEGPEGYATIRYSYKNSSVTETYYDTEGQPYEHDGGYYGRRTEKDGKGQVTEIDYLDRNGALTLNSRGYAMVTMIWSSVGMTRLSYKDTSKRKVTVPSLGYASVSYEYNGSLVKTCTYLDAKDKPVDCSGGYAFFRQNIKKISGRYVVLSSRYDHADGSPATGPDGWFRCSREERDEKGRLLSVKYYDIHKELTDRGAGYAWEGYAYEGSDIVKVTRYNLNDQPVTDAAGVATVVREMKDDRVVKERFLDPAGSRVNNSLGVAEILYSYDHQGALEKVAYQDTEGNPVNCIYGYAGYRDVKDEDGATVSRTFLGTDGNATEIPGGYSEIRYLYDEAKQLTSTRYYDLNGKQIQAE